MRSHLRLASAVGAATLSVIAVAPAMAAAPVSQAGANAVTLSVAGNANGSGDVTATNDGTTETKTGQETPPLSVLDGAQTLVQGGVLAQEATAQFANGTGSSAACAGLAGSGGSVVKVGESRCLSTGRGAANLSLGSLDFSDTDLFDPDSALGAIDSDPVFENALIPVTDALTEALTDANADLAKLGLAANFGAISSHCEATSNSADGDSDFAGVNVSLNVPGQPPVVLLGLDTHYPPDTDVFVDLGTAVDVILQAVEDDLRENLNGAFAPLADEVVAPAREAIVTQVLSQVGEQLAPLSKNVLKLTLNQQTQPSPDAIKVRALDLTVLPAATEQLGADLVNLQIGNVACGPSGRIEAVAGPPPAEPTALPTAVSAGHASAPGTVLPSGDDHTNAIVLGAFALLVASGAGFVTFRRLRG